MILDLPYILETRRNHALEHATLHMLARTHKINMGGHSNPTGFFIFGELRTEDIRAALEEAYTRSTRIRLLLLPLAILFGVFGFILSKPLGTWMQRNLTTEADLGNMRIVEVTPVRKGVHRIITK